ncbi:protein phosphatase 1 regulatory subunit 14C isoform X1 [Macaca thibetana thibetana]|uniref:protein phosphatase 1 regulatory subunit 14C isoform X1 n=1 Tax=Macaca thibetana thibetana TaxID=257877 RepID=UPI0021BC8C65|nr:protein phosphatase 1 regulatory subunit 14C isoform X1 [Macaca thibetana thibetana]
MSVATGSSEAAGGAGGGGARVFFQSPRGGAGGSPSSSSGSGSSREDSAPVATAAAAGQVQQQQQRRHQQGKVTVKYDRKELRKRLVLEEWIVEQLGQLYGCEEEEMPEVEIDIDDLLDADSDEERASKLQEALVDCYKPTEVNKSLFLNAMFELVFIKSICLFLKQTTISGFECVYTN